MGPSLSRKKILCLFNYFFDEASNTASLDVNSFIFQDIFMVLAKTEGCLAPLEARLVPTLVSILDATATSSVAAGDHNIKDGTVSTGLKAVALDILQTVVRAAVVVNGGRSDCLSEVMMTRSGH